MNKWVYYQLAKRKLPERKIVEVKMYGNRTAKVKI